MPSRGPLNELFGEFILKCFPKFNFDDVFGELANDSLNPGWGDMLS